MVNSVIQSCTVSRKGFIKDAGATQTPGKFIANFYLSRPNFSLEIQEQDAEAGVQSIT